MSFLKIIEILVEKLSYQKIPGTEDMKEYKDYWFHIKGSIRGSLIGIPACVLIGLLIILF